MDHETTTKLASLLSKEVLKDNLAEAGLYALAYELLKNSIIERPKGFFTMGGTQPDGQYNAEVLSRHKNTLIAACLWFQENAAPPPPRRTRIRVGGAGNPPTGTGAAR